MNPQPIIELTYSELQVLLEIEIDPKGVHPSKFLMNEAELTGLLEKGLIQKIGVVSSDEKQEAERAISKIIPQLQMAITNKNWTLVTSLVADAKQNDWIIQNQSYAYQTTLLGYQVVNKVDSATVRTAIDVS